MVNARGRRQALNRLDIVFCPQHGVEARNTDRVVPLVHAVFSFGQLGLKPGGAGVQTHPERWLAENVQLHATVTLFSVQAVVAAVVEDSRRHFDLKQCQGAAHAAKVRLYTHFVLLRVHDTGALAVVVC